MVGAIKSGETAEERRRDRREIGLGLERAARRREIASRRGMVDQRWEPAGSHKLGDSEEKLLNENGCAGRSARPI